MLSFKLSQTKDQTSPVVSYFLGRIPSWLLGLSLCGAQPECFFHPFPRKQCTGYCMFANYCIKLLTSLQSKCSLRVKLLPSLFQCCRAEGRCISLWVCIPCEAERAEGAAGLATSSQGNAGTCCSTTKTWPLCFGEQSSLFWWDLMRASTFHLSGREASHSLHRWYSLQTGQEDFSWLAAPCFTRDQTVGLLPWRRGNPVGLKTVLSEHWHHCKMLP